MLSIYFDNYFFVAARWVRYLRASEYSIQFVMPPPVSVFRFGSPLLLMADL